MDLPGLDPEMRVSSFPETTNNSLQVPVHTPRQASPSSTAGVSGGLALPTRFSPKPFKPKAFLVPQWPRLLKLKRQEDALLFAKCLGHTASPCVAEAVAQLPEVRGVQGCQPEARVGRRRPAGLGGFHGHAE